MHIPALLPHGDGHQFVLYGDSCSGIPGALHERTFARVNGIIRRLDPAPEFIVFLGDEIVGLTADSDELRAQWRHFIHNEMSWLDRAQQPVYHVTGNHTAYDPVSEAVFREVLDVPGNGPPGQEGLSYWVRRGDLLLVIVHTLWSGLGGEGHVETAWLRQVLQQHADARYKLVAGHHPVHAVNGFSGPYQREIGPEHKAAFWATLVEHQVLAYLCSHILAFDVQVHRGVLQITTAGAGTAHRMPERTEYLHAVQAALDPQGLRYQVIDDTGQVRERLSWPLRLPRSEEWRDLPLGAGEALIQGPPDPARIVAFRFTGRAAPRGTATAQTLITAHVPSGATLAPLWIGLTGPRQHLTAIMGPEQGRSPHIWHGPALSPGKPFELHVLIHCGMGPGGIMYRLKAHASWSSLAAASPWGAERINWPERWSIGHAQGGPHDRTFLGAWLQAAAVATWVQ